MTQQFQGFSKQSKLISIPETFFSNLLPLIDDIAELKVTLFCMWALQQREGNQRFLTLDDFYADESLMAGLETAVPDSDPKKVLTDALNGAIERGSLLKADIPDTNENTPDVVYLMNSERGRETCDALVAGQIRPGTISEILPPRPNIFRLYEQEIGALTPMISDALQDLEREYPAEWLTEAMRIATEKQARNLKFIRAVLERWRKEGKTTDEITGRHESVEHHGDGRRYISGADAAWIEY